MANLTIKAWEAREVARAPYVTEVPDIIRDLMVLLQKKREERGSTTESSPNSLTLEAMSTGNEMNEGFWGTGWQGGDQNIGMGMGMGIGGTGGNMVGMDMGFGNEGLGDMGDMGMGMVGVVGGRGNEDANSAIYGDFMTGFEGMGGIGTKQFVSGENDW